MTKKVKFQEKGRIKLYQKFWKDNTDEKTAPKILILRYSKCNYLDLNN